MAGWKPVIILAMVATACYTPGRSLAPAGSSIDRSRNFSGSYCFTSGSSREYRSGIGALPFLPMWDVHEQSIITVAQTGEALAFSYTAKDGSRKQQTFDLTKEAATWDGGTLVVHPGFAANPFGFIHTSRTATMYRLADGRLVMTDTHIDTGLGCGLVPYREKAEVVLSMRPALQGCASAISSAE